jgi:3-deoxy-D-manno-octulosonic-acid transferase
MRLYHLFVFLYGLGIKFYSFFNAKAKKWIVGRKDIFRKLPQVGDRNVVWFHCASLGEFDQALPVIEQWNKTDFILVTFFSPSGYENKKDFKGADFICYLPLDTPKNAKKFVEHFSPQNVFFVKYEFWLNYIDALQNIDASIFSLSTVLRPNQHFFKWYGDLFKKRLKKFNYFFVQNGETFQLLQSIGIDQAEITGDTRFDRVLSRKNNITPNQFIQNWLGKEKAFVIGSSWSKDEEIILPVLQQKSSKIIIAPHEVNKKNITRLTQLLPNKFFLYSNLLNGQKSIPKDTQILVLDCIGVLAEAYYFGKHAYVGGAFGSGLHNILEPAAFGLPVIFGPSFSKFPEAKRFIEEGIAQSIRDENDFKTAYEQHDHNHDSMSAKINDFMLKSSGATKKIADYFKELK